MWMLLNVIMLCISITITRVLQIDLDKVNVEQIK